jgi:hypothetical protein
MSDAQGWATVCREFDAIRRDATRYGLAGVYRALEGDAGRDPDRLPEWLELRRQIWECRRHEERYGKYPFDDDLDAELCRFGIPDRAPVTYVCPARRCSRKEPALGRDVPTCGIFERPMNI